MLRAATSLFAGALLLAPSAVSAAPAAAFSASIVDPGVIVDEVPAVFEVAHVVGSGCAPGTTAVAVSPDGSDLEVTFQSFAALVGVGAKATDFRKNCQLGLEVHYPTGFRYAIAQVNYRGHAILAPGASATQRSNYYFSGEAPGAFVSHTFTGPMDAVWQTTDASDLATVHFSPCGQDVTLNINTEVRVNAGSSDTSTTTSLMSMDSATTDTYSLIWRTCD